MSAPSFSSSKARIASRMSFISNLSMTVARVSQKCYNSLITVTTVQYQYHCNKSVRNV
jgi:hypothetical protein